MNARLAVVGAVAVSVVVGAACSSSSSPSSVTPGIGLDGSISAAVDASAFDGAIGSGDSAPGADDGSVAATYNDPTAKSNWEELALASVGVTHTSFSGAVSDGRYLYLMPSFDGLSNPQSIIAQYDTKGAAPTLSTAANWKTFDTKAAVTTAGDFAGGVFDGRYVYFFPEAKQEPKVTSHALRYDTQAAFGASGSWTAFDTTTVAAVGGSSPKGFHGATFDGRYIYLAGGQALGSVNPYATRFDTTKSFTDASSWETYLVTMTVPNAFYAEGVVWDGRYAYFNIVSAFGGYIAQIARYDSQGSFGDSSAWKSFDMSKVGTPLTAYSHGVFDGRYLYYPNTAGQVVRYDSTADFSTLGSWTAFTTTTVDPDAKLFTRAAFDGRYLFLAPAGAAATNRTPMLRFDTTQDFATTASWKATDLYGIGPIPFYGAGALAFDGQSLYVMPSRNDGTSLLRFTDRAPAATSLINHGSFY